MNRQEIYMIGWLKGGFKYLYYRWIKFPRINRELDSELKRLGNLNSKWTKFYKAIEDYFSVGRAK